MGFWNAEKTPGFLKVVIAGIFSSGLAVGGIVWAASGDWHKRGEAIDAVVEAHDKHATSPGLHPTIRSAGELERRLTTLETQQGTLIEDNKELKRGVNELLRRVQ